MIDPLMLSMYVVMIYDISDNNLKNKSGFKKYLRKVLGNVLVNISPSPPNLLQICFCLKDLPKS